MKALIVLGALVIFPTVYGVACIDIAIFQITLANFNINRVKQEIDQLSANEIRDVCRVQVIFSYGQQQLGIAFSKMFEGNNIPVDEVTFFTVIQPDSNNDILYFHGLQYACSSSDGCEKQFVLDHIEWLFNMKFTDFLSNSAPLLLGSGIPPGKCHDFRNNSCLMLQGEVTSFSLQFQFNTLTNHPIFYRTSTIDRMM
jgi:hypothetical protein